MIESVRKATRILTVIADNGGQPLPLGEISARVGINKATCAHIVDTLVCEGFLVKISPTKGYITGPAAYCLSRFGRYGSDLISVCRPVMNYLYNTLGHCVVLAVIQGSTKYVIDYIDDGQIFESKQKIRKDDIYRTATGRAILAYMDRDGVKAVWDKYGKPPKGHWDRVTSYESLLDALDEIRRHSVVVTDATDRSENKDSIGYACPLFHRARCIGAVGIAWKPTDSEGYEKSEKEKMLSALVQKGAKEIMRRLSYEDKELGDT